jgi:alpha-glucosidase
VHPSPNVDWGYDVADYEDVHPEFGTLAELDQLFGELKRRGLRVLLDLVPNHTSSAHRWFSERPEYYVWSPKVPNDWKSIFTGRSAWSYDRKRRAYYLHQFAKEQPDLDWWNGDVRAAFERILRFWFDRGIDGFRIDVAHGLVKDRELRDGVRYMRNRPEVHEIYRRWQQITREYSPKPTLLGETVVPLDDMVGYYGDGSDELDLAMNFDFARAPLRTAELSSIVERTLRLLPPEAMPVWFGSNHDISRLATRWAKGNEARARAALFLLLTLPGVAILYQGDELALADGSVPRNRIRDIAQPSRDPQRTPMPWSRAGSEWVDPWLPLRDTARNVEDQQADEQSTLAYTRDLIERRRAFGDAPYRTLRSRDGVWAYARGDETCVLNLTDDAAKYEGIELAPWEGRIL